MVVLAKFARLVRATDMEGVFRSHDEDDLLRLMSTDDWASRSVRFR